MLKTYQIILDGKEVGSSRLEKADAPMGVVFGAIDFAKDDWSYDTIKAYCHSQNIGLAEDYPEDKFIATSTIDTLIIKNEKGIEIKGAGNQIRGMDGEEFEISVEGIAYPFYREEFPHHVKEYDEMP